MICIILKSVYNKDCCTGHGAARLARLHGVQEALGSNPSAPTKEFLLAGKTGIRRKITADSCFKVQSSNTGSLFDELKRSYY